MDLRKETGGERWTRKGERKKKAERGKWWKRRERGESDDDS